MTCQKNLPQGLWETLALISERVMGFEPTISCLGSKRSTTELHPQMMVRTCPYYIPELIKIKVRSTVVEREKAGLLVPTLLPRHGSCRVRGGNPIYAFLVLLSDHRRWPWIHYSYGGTVRNSRKFMLNFIKNTNYCTLFGDRET